MNAFDYVVDTIRYLFFDSERCWSVATNDDTGIC